MRSAGGARLVEAVAEPLPLVSNRAANGTASAMWRKYEYLPNFQRISLALGYFQQHAEFLLEIRKKSSANKKWEFREMFWRRKKNEDFRLDLLFINEIWWAPAFSGAISKIEIREFVDHRTDN